MACDLVRRVWREMEAEADCRQPEPRDPYLFFVRKVVATACEERRRGKYFCEPKSATSQERVMAETEAFFKSDWLDWWCGWAELDADYVRQRNGVEVSGCK